MTTTEGDAARPRCLVVDDEPSILKTLTLSLQAFGLDTTPCHSPLEALDHARRSDVHFDLAFIDLKMYPIDGIDLMRRLLLLQPGITPVIVTAHGTIDSAVAAIRRGAFDYLQKPFELESLERVTTRALEFHSQGLLLGQREELRKAEDIGRAIVTTDPVMIEQIAYAKRIAPTPLPVLIEGESGTGKELFARLIHASSKRSEGPLVRVNCAALPADLLESELFGHVKGAFTGAHQDRIGRFEAADGGTIFLDEVGEIPPSVQAKLLRVLQEGEFEAVGESRTRRVDVRVLSATNRDLEKETKDGNFREDLFYRLNGVRMRIPPLRERGRDAVAIATAILSDLGSEMEPKLFSPEVLELLGQQEWRGNVRELQNVVKRAAYLAPGSYIVIQDLPEEYRVDIDKPSLRLDDVEREHIRRVIAETESLESAAEQLGIDPATLWRKRKKYGL